MNISYCCTCKTLTDQVELPQKYFTNCRDGYGRGLYVFQCPYCGYKFMAMMKHCNKDEEQYVQYVVEMYYSVEEKLDNTIEFENGSKIEIINCDNITRGKIRT